MTKPTDSEIIALADETRTGESGRDGYILPISFARAVLSKWGTLRAEKIVIPTDTMEQEFQKHYRRGYEAGKKATTPQPTRAQAGAVPLTPKQVAEIADAAHREYDRLVGSGQCAPRWSAVFAHLLERAHGIGIKNGGRHA